VSPGSSYDILIAADCRLDRQRGLRIAEEIRAQTRAGYSTALIHVPDPGIWRGPPFSEPIARCVREGLVDHVDPRDPVQARLLVIHSPGSFLIPLDPPRVRAERVVIVLDARTLSPWGEIAGTTIADVVSAVESWAGARPVVGATRRAVREAIRDAGVQMLAADWTDIIDTARWPRRTAPPGSPPLIGRHDVAGPADFPASAEERLAAYAGDPSVRVALLATTPAVPRLFRGGARPDVFPPGSIDRRGFLAMLDLFVCFPRDETSMGSLRPVLEAIASGVPVIGPSWLESSFGDGTITATPNDVLRIATTLAEDPDTYSERAERALTILNDRFAPESHVARVRDLIGEPSGVPHPPEHLAPRARTRVLFMSSNGAGVGHLMRLMSIARHAGDAIEPVFFTLSQAVSAVRRMGFHVEYMASAEYTRLATPFWNTLLRRRLAEVIDLYKPRAVVFDGTAPYRGLIQARADHPGIPFVWSRRAMWRPGKGSRALERSDSFDLVIEPGEFAAERDQGATVSLRDHACVVDPVTIIGPDDLLPAEQAKRALGLDPHKPAMLVQLGAGNINDISAVSTIALGRLTAIEGLQVCTASSIIGTNGSPILERVTTVSVYPLARYFRAFDFAVSASGYNTFHELIAAGVPTIFIPNLDTSLDDQLARARYAEDVGVGLCIEEFDEEAFDAQLAIMLDPDRRLEMAERCVKLAPGNGAREAMNAIQDLIQRWPRMPVTVPRVRRSRGRAAARRVLRSIVSRSTDAPGRIAGIVRTVGGRTLRRSRLAVKRLTERSDGRRAQPPGSFKRRLWEARAMLRRSKRPARKGGLPVLPGTPLTGRTSDRLPVVFVMLWGLDDETTDLLVDRIATLQRSRLRMRPLFVTDRDHFAPFRAYRYQFEYLMAREEWDGLGLPLSWTEYRWRRLSSLMQTYAPDHTASASGAGAVEQIETALLATIVKPSFDA